MHIVRLLIFLVIPTTLTAQSDSVAKWQAEFPKGDFGRFIVPKEEIEYDGNTRDSIPPIDEPIFVDAASLKGRAPLAPVISLEINGDARAYPLAVMLWHEIVNDVVGGMPVAVTYCPLCNSGVVFRREVGGVLLDFGNTGRIRNLDMVMYDRQTESWWQQFSGRAISGELAHTVLEPLPSRIEGLDSFIARAPDGKFLMPNDASARRYGLTPFEGMDSQPASARFSRWPVPDGVDPLDYVVVANEMAWPLRRLRDAGKLVEAGLTLDWHPGRASLHDTQIIHEGQDIGIVGVKDESGDAVVHDVAFAFAFAAFIPDGTWMLGN